MLTVPHSPWLFPEEHQEVVSTLYDLSLLKFDNARSLPLKSGGKTDIYINLRNARSNPAALTFVSDLFSIPLKRLGPDRFIEIPDSVSCFAGQLSVATNIPFITIREQAKENRVTKATTIGDYKAGERVCIIDDVITDGASKIQPILTCQELGLRNQALVVLVDRQQGWRDKLIGEFGSLSGIHTNVWPGMTLHDVRRQLVELGMMVRCEFSKEEKNPIIVALDGKGWDEILPLVDQLRTTGCILKVNDFLFEEGMKGLIPNLSIYGRVMADLKGHDIKETVFNTCHRLAKYKPWAVTVHASGSTEMIQAAVKGLEESPQTKVLAVTVLTSILDDCTEIYVRQPIEQVMRLAEIANKAGAHGLVCSAQEVRELRSRYPKMTLVTPGIRSEGKDVHEQKRVGTPKQAIEDGSNYLVMGRQLLGAKDPVVEVSRVLTEELGLSI